MKLNPKNFTYHFYRERIGSLARDLGFNLITYAPYHEHPSLQTLLIYNAALLKSHTGALHITGTHGVEGAVGAEIQLALLLKHGKELRDSKHGVLFIFALNPFGFHFIRRTSIENIDLNRNTGDGIQKASIESAFQKLRPLWRPNSHWGIIKGLGAGLALGLKNGFTEVGRAFVEGQDLEPQGLFYSGQREAIEVTTLLQNLRPLLNEKKHLRVLEVHTGLGHLYEEILFHCAGNTEDSSTLFAKPIVIPGTTANTYRGVGLLADRLVQRLPSTRHLHIIQELGIKSTAHSFLALILENTYHWNQFNKTSESLYLKHPIKRFFFNTFCSMDSEWLEWAKREGSQRFLALLTNFNY